MTDPLGQSQILPYHKGIAAAGHEITLVSFEKKIRYQTTGAELALEIRKYGIEWYPFTYTKSPPVFATIWDIFRLILVVVEIQKRKKFDIVHCRSYITTFAGHYLQKKFGMKFIFDMRGFWADERVEGGLWNLKKPIYNLVYKYFKRKEKQWLQDANHIISLTENAKEYISSPKSGFLKDIGQKITVIPCCTDTQLFNSQNVDFQKVVNIRQDFKISSGQMVIGYLGSVGTWYMLDEMLLFFKQIKSKNEDAVFVILTAENPEFIIAKAIKNNIDANDLRICEVKRVDLPNYISIFDLSLCFVKPSFSKKASSPTKLGELMAMGIPVICNAGVGDVDLLLNKYKTGYLLPNFDESDIQKAVDFTEDLLQIDKQKIREVAVEVFGLERGVEAYLLSYEC